jgi:FAD:protein FMN transferase
MKGKPTRRDFLLGRADVPPPPRAGEGMAAGPDGPARSEDSPAADPHLIHVSRRAMACDFEVTFVAGQYPDGAEIALAALDLVDQLEEQMSVFRPASEITRINRLAAEGPVAVEPLLWDVLQRALQIGRETGGAYDITSGPLWEAWGFARRKGAIPSPEQLADARQRVGGHLVELDSQRHTVRFLRPGVQLNLGSIGKGHALDRSTQIFLEGGMRDFLMHGGNSSVLARGARVSQPWTVGIRDPLHPDRRVAEVRLRDQALGTSGAQFQSFHHRGRRYGHILDPRTGWPAESVLSATVIAPSAALADALSTAFYVMGPDAALDYCRTHPEIAAVFLCPASHGSRCEVRTIALGDDQWHGF